MDEDDKSMLLTLADNVTKTYRITFHTSLYNTNLISINAYYTSHIFKHIFQFINVSQYNHRTSINGGAKMSAIAETQRHSIKYRKLAASCLHGVLNRALSKLDKGGVLAAFFQTHDDDDDAIELVCPTMQVVDWRGVPEKKDGLNAQAVHGDAFGEVLVMIITLHRDENAGDTLLFDNVDGDVDVKALSGPEISAYFQPFECKALDSDENG
jgi:hypothetical protein